MEGERMGARELRNTTHVTVRLLAKLFVYVSYCILVMPISRLAFHSTDVYSIDGYQWTVQLSAYARYVLQYGHQLIRMEIVAVPLIVDNQLILMLAQCY